MYKQVLIPNKNNNHIDLPEKFFGKKVEVIVVEISDLNSHPIPPAGKKIEINELFENFGAAPDFPTISEIREKAWPSKW